ncbi:LOW QUALITY PROTEIN: protein PLASTID MOVEMENT IMPAIRED 1-RELATED 1 [Vigna angularis]|nr:LOW QUALITY PROTEIN: protein PLASTID MOVEMENT IMPAIRED 1-RELATED 1 [Vigna angularis]
MSTAEGGKSSAEENNLPLKDVETVDKALRIEKSSSKNSKYSKSQLFDPKSKVKDSEEDNLRKDKKFVWNWKSLKALSLSRSKKFNCSFSVKVHVIEGLPSSFNDSCLCVYWKRKDTLLVTPPAKVIQGVAEFQDILTRTCSINGSRSGPQNSAKYEAKPFMLYASKAGFPEVDLGKHRVDLTRLLPLTLEELEEEKRSGIWTTSFRLSGTARGAVINVSFGYVIVGDNTSATRDNLCDIPNVLTTKKNGMPLLEPDKKPSQVDGSKDLPSFSSDDYSSQNVDEVKDLHEVFPSSNSARISPVYISCKEFVEEMGGSPLHGKPELEGIKENIDPIKPVVCSSFDNEKDKAEENQGDEGKTCSPMHDKPEVFVFQQNLDTVTPNDYPLPDSAIENFKECEGNEFSVLDKGIEFSSDEHVKLEESIGKAFIDVYTVDSTRTLDNTDIQVSFQDHDNQDSLEELNDNFKESAVVREFSNRKDDLPTKEHLLQELESALTSVSELETAAMDSPVAMEAKSEDKLRKSKSWDDVTESVASEFLSMLGIDNSPRGFSFEGETESPRELLLRQFENEVRSEGFSLFDFDIGSDDEADSGNDSSYGTEHWKFSKDTKSASLMQDVHKGHLIEFEDVRSKQKVRMLEHLETEALMRKWGLNEMAFQNSPKKDHNGLGSPIYFLPEETLPLPPLAEGLGPFLQTEDGGFLRSMNPTLFRKSRTGGTLIMQVSNPIVVPAEMGTGIMEILQCFASVGIEKLSKQANKLMPLQDITGKTMQQISREAKPVLGRTYRQLNLQHNLVTGQYSTCAKKGLKGILSGGQMSNKFSSDSAGDHKSSDLALLAMDKIEALSLEGLRIQSGMSNGDAPSNIIAESYGDNSALQGKGAGTRGSLGLDGTAAMQLLDMKNSNSDEYDGVDGIMALSLTLDEWMRLDSGEIDEDIDNISERTYKLLAAHHANSLTISGKSSKGERKSGRKYGLLGNKFIVALMEQLRDPLRNYEPVGTPMLGLIQVERVFIQPKQEIYRPLCEAGKESDECEIVGKVEMKGKREEKSSEEEGIPQFKITEVHVAGVQKRKFWSSLGRRRQQEQSASWWLIANGMGKNLKNPVLKSNAPITTTNVQPGDSLWSISSRIYGTLTRWNW